METERLSLSNKEVLYKFSKLYPTDYCVCNWGNDKFEIAVFSKGKEARKYYKCITKNGAEDEFFCIMKNGEIIRQ